MPSGDTTIHLVITNPQSIPGPKSLKWILAWMPGAPRDRRTSHSPCLPEAGVLQPCLGSLGSTCVASHSARPSSPPRSSALYTRARTSRVSMELWPSPTSTPLKVGGMVPQSHTHRPGLSPSSQQSQTVLPTPTGCYILAHSGLCLSLQHLTSSPARGLEHPPF